MNVVSIDPAPSKSAVVFDGKLHSVPAAQLVDYCSALVEKPDTLLCWDAPLTGPASNVGSYSQRTIEKFFSRKETGFKAPKGISVLPYSGCPHWAITRACLGLPICGQYGRSESELPFLLATDRSEIKQGKARVVESHPAVAIWLWCRSSRGDSDAHGAEWSWVYKGSKSSTSIEELWEALTEEWRMIGNSAVEDMVSRVAVPANDDQLDAIVGWVLGTLLVAGDPSVEILGDRVNGAIALPATPFLKNRFREFSDKTRII